MNMEGLSDLAAVSAMIRDRDLAAVEEIVAEIRRLEGDVARLRAVRDARLAEGALDAARLAGADPVWLAWSEERLMRLSMQIAHLRARHDSALAKARKSFGRAEVTRELLEGRGGRTGG